MAGREYLLFAASVVALLAFSGTASAQNLTANQTYLIAAAQYAQCKTNFTSAFIGQAASAVPRLSSLGKYSATLQSESAQLASIAAAGSVPAFRAYLSGTYDPELNAISANASAQMRAANLSRNQTSQLRLLYNSSLSAYSACRLNSIRSAAMKKLALFNGSIASYQRETNTLSQQGIGTGALNLLLQNARSRIVAPLASAVAGATNSSQVSAALNQYCLFDGCRNGTNFHLAAHFELDKLAAEVSYLESTRNMSSSSMAAAQADLGNATLMLSTVGNSVYAGSQSGVIFGNLTIASKVIRQAGQQQALTKTRQAAANVIAGYNKSIAGYRAAIAKLAAEGVSTAGLNQTLSNATAQVILPLQNALGSATNLTQLTSAFRARCLENGCANGTNFHLGIQLKLGEAQAELAYLSAKTGASSAGVIVNATALSAARGYLANVSSMVSSVGGAQLSNGLIVAISSDSGNFATALTHAYTVGRSATASGATSSKPTAKSTSATATGVPQPLPVSGGGKVSANASANGTTSVPRKNASASPPIVVIGKVGGTTAAGAASGPGSNSASPSIPAPTAAGNALR